MATPKDPIISAICADHRLKIDKQPVYDYPYYYSKKQVKARMRQTYRKRILNYYVSSPRLILGTMELLILSCDTEDLDEFGWLSGQLQAHISILRHEVLDKMAKNHANDPAYLDKIRRWKTTQLEVLGFDAVANPPDLSTPKSFDFPSLQNKLDLLFRRVRSTGSPLSEESDA